MSERRDSRDRTANARRGGNSGWSRWKLSVGELPEKPGIAVHATRRGRHARWHAGGTPALLNAHIRKLLVRMGSSVGRPSRLTTNAGERSPGPHQPHEKMGRRDARPAERPHSQAACAEAGAPVHRRRPPASRRPDPSANAMIPLRLHRPRAGGAGDLSQRPRGSHSPPARGCGDPSDPSDQSASIPSPRPRVREPRRSGGSGGGDQPRATTVTVTENCRQTPEPRTRPFTA